MGVTIDGHGNVIMRWEYDDGGRAAVGYQGSARDCATRAVAIALDLPYHEVYEELRAMGAIERRITRKKSHPRTGVWRDTLTKYLARRGWVWTPTMQIGRGCTVHLRNDELPPGRVIVRLSRHVAAVVDGVLRDIHDCSREGTRCVYGYWARGA